MAKPEASAALRKITDLVVIKFIPLRWPAVIAKLPSVHKSVCPLPWWSAMWSACQSRPPPTTSEEAAFQSSGQYRPHRGQEYQQSSSMRWTFGSRACRRWAAKPLRLQRSAMGRKQPVTTDRDRPINTLCPRPRASLPRDGGERIMSLGRPNRLLSYSPDCLGWCHQLAA
jgi:hypothetical protein